MRPAAEEVTDGRPPTALVRIGILIGMVVLLFVMLTPTVRLLLRQRAETAELQSRIVEQQGEVATLQAELDKWKDPSFVEQQARARLGFVKVGDKVYSVVGGGGAASSPVEVPGATVAAPGADSRAPWYSQVWQSVAMADKPTAGMLPAKQ